jgi:hypothetical protein
MVTEPEFKAYQEKNAVAIKDLLGKLCKSHGPVDVI